MLGAILSFVLNFIRLQISKTFSKSSKRTFSSFSINGGPLLFSFRFPIEKQQQKLSEGFPFMGELCWAPPSQNQHFLIPEVSNFTVGITTSFSTKIIYLAPPLVSFQIFPKCRGRLASFLSSGRCLDDLLHVFSGWRTLCSYSMDSWSTVGPLWIEDMSSVDIGPSAVLL